MQQQRRGRKDSIFTLIISIFILILLDMRWEGNESETAILIPPPTNILALQ